MTTTVSPVPSPAPAQPRYLRASGACDYLKIGRSTLWAWVKTRPEFPRPLKIGPKVTVFDVAAIEQFISGTQA